MTDQNSETGFSREYVEKLRSEAAGYRTQLRELETQQTNGAIESELAKRGMMADPKWIEVSEGMNAHDAVENFVAKYPHMATKAPQAPHQAPAVLPTKPTMPHIQGPQTPSTNVPTHPSQGRSLAEIQKDPVARGQLRDRYRQMISQSSRQRDPTNY